jgi:hypothetical protein
MGGDRIITHNDLRINPDVNHLRYQISGPVREPSESQVLVSKGVIMHSLILPENGISVLIEFDG